MPELEDSEYIHTLGIGSTKIESMQVICPHYQPGESTQHLLDLIAKYKQEGWSLQGQIMVQPYANLLAKTSACLSTLYFRRADVNGYQLFDSERCKTTLLIGDPVEYVPVRIG